MWSCGVGVPCMFGGRSDSSMLSYPIMISIMFNAIKGVLG